MYIKRYAEMVEGNTPERDWYAEYDNYINAREREHFESSEYGCDDNQMPPDWDWRSIHDMIDWKSQTYFS